MKVLLLNHPNSDCKESDAERFSEMSKSLDIVGIESRYYEFHSRDQLNCLLLLEHPDIVYCADYYTKDEFLNQVSVHSFLDELNFPYIGSNHETLEFVLSKSDLKIMWSVNKVTTPAFFQVHKLGSQVFGLETLNEAVDYPYILKPDLEGNSRGINETSIVFDHNSLKLKLEDLLKSYKAVLIEKYLGTASDIREFTVAMIGNGKNKLIMPAEISLLRQKKHRIITTEDKENHFTQASQIVDKELNAELASFAEKAFETAGVRDYSRCDVLLTDGQFYAIEINGLPMIPDKWFEACACGVGLEPFQYINAIFLAGLVRNINDGHHELTIPHKLMENLPMHILDVISKNNS